METYNMQSQVYPPCGEDRGMSSPATEQDLHWITLDHTCYKNRII